MSEGCHKHTQKEEMRVCRHSFTRTHAYSHTESGGQAQQYPLQAAISMEMVLIVPTDHTYSQRSAGPLSHRQPEGERGLPLSRPRPH